MAEAPGLLLCCWSEMEYQLRYYGYWGLVLDVGVAAGVPRMRNPIIYCHATMHAVQAEELED